MPPRKRSVSFSEQANSSSHDAEKKEKESRKREEVLFSSVENLKEDPAEDLPANAHHHYETLEEVTNALKRAGLKSSNLILGIDYTKSNEDNGEQTFEGRSLHDVSGSPNPYQNVIEILGQTLEPFDDDNLIPTFGFGDAVTTNQGVFPFFSDRRPCKTFREVLSQYLEITPNIELSGPTNFGPLIREAIKIVRDTKTFHILVIIADGQVVNDNDTSNAIVEASHYPLSIIMVGVGDGPWSMMEFFDTKLLKRKFDNFHFVNFHDIITGKAKNPVTAFAMAALQEVPTQFESVVKLGYVH